jgi:hypothetical protein
MVKYKLYILDEHDWVMGIETLHCDDDESAVIMALGYAPEQHMELWASDRLIQRFGPQPDDDDDTDQGEAACARGRFGRGRAGGLIRTPARSAQPPSWARRGATSEGPAEGPPEAGRPSAPTNRKAAGERRRHWRPTSAER